LKFSGFKPQLLEQENLTIKQICKKYENQFKQFEPTKSRLQSIEEEN
jgi:hypothetical protein